MMGAGTLTTPGVADPSVATDDGISVVLGPDEPEL